MTLTDEQRETLESTTNDHDYLVAALPMLPTESDLTDVVKWYIEMAGSELLGDEIDIKLGVILCEAVEIKLNPKHMSEL